MSAGMTDVASGALLISDRDGVRTLTLNRPERRNALNTDLSRSLLAALRNADADPAVNAVLLTGNGPVFCAGADLGEFKGATDPAPSILRSEILCEMQIAFGQLAVPVVCALHGAALGFGAALVNLSDMAVMGEGARLGYPELQHGMVPSLMLPVIQHAVSGKKSFELLAMAQPIGAAEALALGLVNAVVPNEAVAERALQMATALAKVDRDALRETKLMSAVMANMSLADAMRYGRDASARRAAANQANQAKKH